MKHFVQAIAFGTASFAVSTALAFASPTGEDALHSAAKLAVSQFYCGDVFNYDAERVQDVFEAARDNSSYLNQQWFAEYVKTHEGGAKLSVRGHCLAIYDLFGPSGYEFPGVVTRK